MKITKRQLRRIIREEKARLLKENVGNIPLSYFDTPPRTEPMAPHAPRPATPEEIFEDYVTEIEKVVEFHGQEFSDEGIKAAVAAALARIGIGGMETVKIGKPTSQKHITGRKTV